MLIAAAGVAVSLVMFGKVPVMGLILAASFTAYGVFKKLAKADGVVRFERLGKDRKQVSVYPAE